MRVVDLSADFRLRSAEVYEQWYRQHVAPELLPRAVYGLPELGTASDSSADVVANPGCYPTAALLALAPLARAGLVEDVVIDAKSGVRGAGAGATEQDPLRDRRRERQLLTGYRATGTRLRSSRSSRCSAPLCVITFTPHLLPLDQGELVSCYVSLQRGSADLDALYADAYADEPFVELAANPPGVRDVRETNICRISVHRDMRTGRAIVFGAIDNLWKGAASQAVQNLNLMFGLPEGEGIS